MYYVVCVCACVHACICVRAHMAVCVHVCVRVCMYDHHYIITHVIVCLFCLRMDDRGEVISIKFSYDMKILAIQRSDKSIVSFFFLHCVVHGIVSYQSLLSGKIKMLLFTVDIVHNHM